MNADTKRGGQRPRKNRNIEGHDQAGGPEELWQMRRALGRQLAALRNRAGLSQWEFAPLTGYSRSTLSDAELGRHRLRREFWLRVDELLKADGHLVGSYDRIETAATVMRQRARSTAQLNREQHATARLRAIGPADPAGAGGPAGLGHPAGSGDPAGVRGRNGEASGNAEAGRNGAGQPSGPDAGGPAEGSGAGPPVPGTRVRADVCPHCHRPIAVLIVPGARGVPDPRGR